MRTLGENGELFCFLLTIAVHNIGDIERFDHWEGSKEADLKVIL